MADNIALPASGVTAATDEIGAVHHQLVKVEYGADGSATRVSPANPLPVAVQGASLTGTSQAIAAGGTGTAGPLSVATAGNCTFIARNTTPTSAWAGAPVLVFEQSDDGTSWAPLLVVRSDTNMAASTFTLGANSANVAIMFDAALEGVNYVRCRVTTGPATNGMTIVIQPGGMPFSPVVTTIPNGAGTITGGGPVAVPAAAVDTLILAANAARRGGSIYNDSPAVLYLSLGTNAASLTSFSVPMNAKGYYEIGFNYVGMIRGIWSANPTGNARVSEGAP